MMIRGLRYLLVVTVGAWACVQTSPAAGRGAQGERLLSVDERAATVVVAAQLFLFATEPVPVCVELQDSVARYTPDSAFMLALGPRARTRANCPRTYASMIYDPSAPPRPAGYVDPYQLVLWRPARADDGTSVSAQLWQGTRFTAYQCSVKRTDTAWTAVCRETARGVS